MNLPIKLEKFDVREINWEMSDLIQRNCPICNNTESQQLFIRPDNLVVHLCSNCSTYFISPAPSHNQIVSFYSNYDNEYRAELDITKEQLKRELVHSEPFSDYRIEVISNFMNLNGAKVFDIGFGRAKFLYFLKKLGALTYGNEFDAKAIELAKYLGIDNVFDVEIENLNYDDFFDLITLNDIVEHPLDPTDLIIQAIKRTKPGGLISIWTPNGKSGVERKDNLTFRVDLEHMQYFTKKTFEFIAQRYNLEILHLEVIGHPSLFGIAKLISKIDIAKYKFKNIIKLLPGVFPIINFLKKKRQRNQINSDKGSYILFCIFRKKA
jgi:2-polyprenyl-3-methyl-5-hydroxy-6-metoxy-1,4-benzoquinol methylase